MLFASLLIFYFFSDWQNYTHENEIPHNFTLSQNFGSVEISCGLNNSIK